MRGRLGRESVFLVLAAALAGLLEPGWPLFILVMVVALLLVAAVELLLSRRPPVAVEDVPVAIEAASAGSDMFEAEAEPPSTLAPPSSIAPVLTPPEPTTLPAEEPSPPEHTAETPAAPRREWNLSELEQLARERAGVDLVRDQERLFLLVYLRAFVRPDGLLPQDFDGLVRESFGELLSSRL